MKLGLFTAYYEHQPLEKVCAYASELGYEAIELACWYGSSHLDADRAVTDASYVTEIRRTVKRYGLEIRVFRIILTGSSSSDLSIINGQLGPSLRPRGEGAIRNRTHDLDRACRKRARGAMCYRLCRFSRLGPVVQPRPGNGGDVRRRLESLRRAWHPILDAYRDAGVRFALEVHPVQIAYNIETSARALEALDHRPEFGFNFDPSHFVWQLIDPCLFIREFGDRIFHVHAKDTELVRTNLARSGVLAGGAWERIDRGVRFRCPGWGEIDWRRVITALAEAEYDSVISYDTRIRSLPLRMLPRSAPTTCSRFLSKRVDLVLREDALPQHRWDLRECHWPGRR